LAVPVGVLSTTGIAGLTLGGGTGYLTRKYGLALDNLLEADLVLADGRFVTVGAKENQDLFWGIRGGGGNFGIVTSFLYRGCPVDQVFGTFPALYASSVIDRSAGSEAVSLKMRA
jgi:FAD/FMN-containing dehydrogenase